MGKLGNMCAKRVPNSDLGVQILFWGNKDSPKFKVQGPKSRRRKDRPVIPAGP